MPRRGDLHRGDGTVAVQQHLAADRPVCDILRFTGQGTFKETVPVLDDHGQMTPTEVTRELGVDVALRWGTGYDSTLRSFVNSIATPKGGTHVAGFEQAVRETMNEVLRAKKLLRVAEDDIVKDDALEGLTARNQLRGTDVSLRRDGILSEVILRLGDGQEIVSVVTSDSALRLGLAVGETATAVIKSTEVMLFR